MHLFVLVCDYKKGPWEFALHLTSFHDVHTLVSADAHRSLDASAPAAAAWSSPPSGVPFREGRVRGEGCAGQRLSVPGEEDPSSREWGEASDQDGRASPSQKAVSIGLLTLVYVRVGDS